VQHEEAALAVTDSDGILVGSVQPHSVVDALALEAQEATEARESDTNALEMESASLRITSEATEEEEKAVSTS
jgi:NAD(P)H-dependent FMN reductase